MLESGILLLYVATAALAVLGSAALIYSQETNYDAVYCYMVDSKWRDIPTNVASRYLVFLRRLFGENLFGWRAGANAALLASAITLAIMIGWRAVAVGSLWPAVHDTIGTRFGLATFAWVISAAAVAPLSLFATSFFLGRAVKAQPPAKVLAYMSMDAAVAYVLVGTSVYLCIITTTPALVWYAEGLERAIETMTLFVGYAHGPASIWPKTSGVAISGLSAVTVGVATVFPTVLFIVLTVLSFISVVFFKVTAPIIVGHLQWVSEQAAARLAKCAAVSVSLAGALAAVAKVLELMAS